jgi:hypothetical protein
VAWQRGAPKKNKIESDVYLKIGIFLFRRYFFILGRYFFILKKSQNKKKQNKPPTYYLPHLVAICQIYGGRGQGPIKHFFRFLSQAIIWAFYWFFSGAQ